MEQGNKSALDISQIERRSKDRCPLYCHYDNQSSPQSAYIYLTDEGKVYAEYNREIGYSITFAVVDGLTMRFPISPYLSGQGLLSAVESVLPLLEALHAEHTTKWDHEKTRVVGYLTETGMMLKSEIEFILSEVEPDFSVWSIEEWFVDWRTDLEGKDIETYVDEIFDMAGPEDVLAFTKEEAKEFLERKLADD